MAALDAPRNRPSKQEHPFDAHQKSGVLTPVRLQWTCDKHAPEGTGRMLRWDENPPLAADSTYARGARPVRQAAVQLIEGLFTDTDMPRRQGGTPQALTRRVTKPLTRSMLPPGPWCLSAQPRHLVRSLVIVIMQRCSRRPQTWCPYARNARH